ncbi:MAG: VWA domain-containing protein [Planctomycetales bacterium]
MLTTMEWTHPQWLYLILPLCGGGLVLWLVARRAWCQAAEAFVAADLQPRILPTPSAARFWIKGACRLLAIVAGLAALAGPRFGTQSQKVQPRGSDLYVLIDVSRSMLADDVPPSRLGRAKGDVAALVQRLRGERVGLIAFAGQAVVKCPLTVDYDMFRRALDELDTDSAPRGGTAIGDAIRKALEVFHPAAQRDQAVLLITDGDDQQSYPLEAAALAAERQVAIFAVGLGDADQGARIPGVSTGSFVEYEGRQVWSKLDGSLLQELALKTSGVYVPVGTRAYDLGELYADYLQGRRGAADESHTRLVRAEQFQLFLAVALLALLVDLCIWPYCAATPPPARQGAAVVTTRRSSVLPVAVGLLCWLGVVAPVIAGEPQSAVREGLRLYSAGEFEPAREQFAAAAAALSEQKGSPSAIATFDEACACHRQGETERARELYLQAGLSRDRRLAASAHFNLGTLIVEGARAAAGEHPEQTPPDKRQEIIDQLKGAVGSFRHSLELQPDNPRARRNIELVRQWIKYYTTRWQELDRERRRRELNLLQFIEYLIQAQAALRQSVLSLENPSPADIWAELKRVQDELHQEIEPLKEKLRSDLTPPESDPGQSGEVEESLKLLQEWADAAGEKMVQAAGRLQGRQGNPATEAQQEAIAELEKIWEGIVPFRQLLARALADQTAIVRTLRPSQGGVPTDEKSEETRSDPADPGLTPSETEEPPAEPAALAAELSPEEFARLEELQQKTWRRTQLLPFKAQGELDRMAQEAGEKPAPPEEEADNDPQAGATPSEEGKVDPEQIKAGFEAAIERAPQAAAQMELAMRGLRQKRGSQAFPPAEEARRILEELQQKQPPEQSPQQKPSDDQQSGEQKPQEQEPEDSEQNSEQEKSQKSEPEDKPQPKEQEEKGAQPDSKPDQQKPSPSSDRTEDALRKVREREQEKRERDRRLRVRLRGRIPVDKDW